MDTTSMFVPVILAGGSGERFWPLSRRHRPKQFLTLDDSGRSLLQATSGRRPGFLGDRLAEKLEICLLGMRGQSS